MTSETTEKVAEKLPYGYSLGIQRPYYQAVASAATYTRRTALSTTDAIFLLMIALFATLTSLVNIEKPRTPLFQEPAIVETISNYYNGTFFVPAHPPLVDLVYYMLARFSQYQGGFPGFSNDLAYVFLRAFGVICRVFTIILSFFVMKNAGCRGTTAMFGTSLVLFENSMLTYAKYMNTETPYVLLCLIAVFGFQRGVLMAPQPASFTAALYMTLSGLSVGCAISLHWAGVSTWAFLLILSAIRMWYVAGDIRVSSSTVFRIAVTKAATLLVLPLTIYFAVFSVHLSLTSKASPMLSYMSPHFKAGISDSSVHGTTAPLCFGGAVTIRHLATGAYLHSSNHTLPNSPDSKHIVSGYGLEDASNEWIIERKDRSQMVPGKFSQVRDLTVVRLLHRVSSQYLEVANERPPVSEQEYNNLVFSTGNISYAGSVNNNFQLKVVRDFSTSGLSSTRIESIDVAFQINNLGTGCFLMSHDAMLPSDWTASAEREVFCNNSPALENSLWYVEKNENEHLDSDADAQHIRFAMPHWKRVVELSYQMARMLWLKRKSSDDVNTGVAWTWPVPLTGMTLYQSLELGHGSIVFGVGSLPTYFLAVGFLATFIATKLPQMMKLLSPYAQRKVYNEAYDTYINALWVAALGWLIHFYPFTKPQVVQSLELTPANYLPALMFGILGVASTMEFVASKNFVAGSAMMVGFLAAAFYFFLTYKALIYGMAWDEAACWASKVFPDWDYDCTAFKVYEAL
ncbi:glycosyltransferase family 39 protein [Babjeviella inositovora NRRL Y-12698]|uniref:Dolichyl-phosphate-mannose--protein mannosyltransferase n=1 Tax=Babjeviella inositovora NRRL Y-12698 TaxID=984486 RepID=A0A1E3QVH7_9ASCO|nr:glycosyltransferase family 39 protein [Babjeviella inositovora NRRL Y-12698]ODQ80967.1 glycosyltransferase family 39 protein [Babjeviella inositovora NRRL Y-12698]